MHKHDCVDTLQVHWVWHKTTYTMQTANVLFMWTVMEPECKPLHWIQGMQLLLIMISGEPARRCFCKAFHYEMKTTFIFYWHQWGLLYSFHCLCLAFMYICTIHALCILFNCYFFVCRLEMMFWSDVTSNTISSAHLNGTGLRVLVNSSIGVPGDMLVFICSIVTAVSISHSSEQHQQFICLWQTYHSIVCDTMLG